MRGWFYRLALGAVIGWLALTNSASALEKPKLAIIIDDLGYNLPLGKRTAQLPGAFTLAVLPLTPYGRELANLAHRQGKEVMLHVPMSNHHQYPLGKGALVTGMKRAEFITVLRRGLADIPHVKGVNNHMGSLLTEQAEPMGWLMQELQSRQLYFVDSRTSVRTQALIEAERIQLPSRRRDVFLDDTRDKSLIEQQVLLAIRKARRQGFAIAIGHPYPETLEVLKRIRPLLKNYDVELVPVSALMPGFARHSNKIAACTAPPLHLWPRIWVPVNPFDKELVELPEQFWITRSKK